ncbi:4-alpha-glucanotransferase [Marichromatium purpuratum 984]|uniref:4-alpha-glucanotransferase n=1 Tax=Marichromatium purpuratum 984 TaxID=765910 RepID=W0E3S2_MARPU|nr:4-alpha-glucanotransferase [Marichromatium purpuratum]AHF03721.1 4-alpha-glucanotransferase [Marichromatium purpuratum 984]
MHRTSGILLHPTSLPSPFGIGDLGPGAYRFVDFLAAAGQGLWQMLPLGPTGYHDSPYQCTSAFAGNPLLISPQRLLEAGWLDPEDLEQAPAFAADRVEYEAVGAWKRALLERARRGFEARATAVQREAYAAFCETHGDWLEDFALYSGLKAFHAQRPWTQWARDYALRDPGALARWAAANGEALALQRFVQFCFFEQWQALRDYAHARGVRLIGDIPIFVAHDSSEVWTHPHWFELDAEGEPTVVAGVPPDYFSATGQRWGNPLYRWSALAADDYAFWVARLRQVLGLVDLVRVDHFRGFAGYWEIPADEPTAVNGRWVAGPGMRLFSVLQAALGEDPPLIAEDLGVITEDVEALRDGLGLPGMAILQFGFEDIPEGFGRSYFLPHHHRPRQAVYTGTHDNNTLRGWWDSRDESVRRHARVYLNTDGHEIHWDFIRSALGSVAEMALFPLQDVLGLGAEACMNRPGTAEGNWEWRFREEMLEAGSAERLRALSRLFGRLPHPEG